MSRSNLRGLAFEALQPRQVFAAIEFLTLESSMMNLAVNSLSSTGTSIDSQYRQLSSVVDNRIFTLGVHPSGSKLNEHTQPLTLPAGAVDAVIETAFGRNSGVGYAVDGSGQTETILWVHSNLPISLEKATPLAGTMNTDGTVLLVTASNQAVRVVHYAADGSELRAVQLDGEIYSRAQIVSDGVILFGAENDQPVAAFIDLEFNVTEVELTLPPNATFASTIGLSRRGNESFYTGTALDSAGESRVIFWDMTGQPMEQLDTTDIWAVKASGKSMLVDTEQGIAVIVRDQALASLLGIEVDTPAVASQIPALGEQGLADVSITEVIQREEEIFLTVIGVNESGELTHGLLAASLRQFPSPWQNFQNQFDVNESQQVSPIDALLIINRLRNPADRILGSADLNDSFRYDVNGSGTITPSDALLVINQIRVSRGSAEGEGEGEPEHAPWIGSDGVFGAAESEEQLRKSRRDLS